VHWAHVQHPQGGEKFFSGPNLQEKVVSVLPPDRECTLKVEQESILGNWAMWTVEEVIYVVLACFFSGRRLKKVRKVHPRQNPGYAYGNPSKISIGLYT